MVSRANSSSFVIGGSLDSNTMIAYFWALLLIGGAYLIKKSPTKYAVLDPILTFVFILITWCATTRVIYSCMDVLLESTPDYFISKTGTNG